MNKIEKAIEDFKICITDMEDITECEGMRKSFVVGIEALEKRIPKTVIYDTYDDTFSCPECDSDITNTDYTYCPYCGIRLGDVVEVDEDEGEQEDDQ